MKNTHLIIMLLITIGILSCNSDNETGENNSIISQEIKELIYFIGNENASTVLINVQSGPDVELVTTDINEVIQSFSDNSFLTVNVHQAQTLHPNIITSNEITFDEAIMIDKETVELLFKVISYFKEQGRTVYVFGQSFGAFVTQELIASKGINVADKYLIMIGRLDMNDIIWQGLSEGRYGFFENGINPILEDEITSNIIDRNLAKLAAGFGMNKYTQLFSDFQDLSKITYIYGQRDEIVGSLTENEKEFLVSKNVNMISGNGGHDETLSQYFMQGFEEAFGIK